jgi:hypothetical protein
MSVSRVAPPLVQSPIPSVATTTPQTPQANPVDKSQLIGLVDKVKTTIDALGDTLKALDISERESLRPMWGVLKEGLEILNGEPDDWDFSSTTTQDQLKQLSLILNLHGQKFKGYINAEQQKHTDLTSFGKVCTILSKVCEALSSELTKFTPKAEIIDFNIGVNKGATVLATNPIIGEAVSGSEYANTRVNNKSRDRLQNATNKRLDNMQTKLNEKNFQRTNNQPTNSADLKKLDNEIKALSRDIATIKELSDQIAAIWEDGSYREAGNEPYKLASRVALLSHLLGGGTVFNCKSGKDRTAQLDAEVKFLAFQIRTSNGKVPKPDRKRTNLEKIQFATFIFFDESRRKMQEFNTGYGGSKLVDQPALYGNFIPSTGDTKYSKKNMAATIKQFLGLSKAVPS